MWRRGRSVSCRAAHKAFTLVEMLVSLAITSAIVTMVYGSYAAASRSVGVCSSRMACSERAHLVLRIMARQIRCAYMPPAAANSKPDPAAEHKTTPVPSVPAFRGEPGGLQGDLLNVTTAGGFGLDFDSPAGISRVAYRYDKPRSTLLICCEPGVGSDDGLRQSAAWRPILTGVAGVELAFYDGRQWQSKWDSRQAGRLPQAVKIALAVAEKSGRTHHYA